MGRAGRRAASRERQETNREDWIGHVRRRWPDGTGETAVANSADDETPETTTASGRIIYSREVGGQPDIYSVDDDGKGLVILSNAADIEIVVGVR
jgi:hypothetical protein